MPRGSRPEGEHALSNAERHARYRAQHLAALARSPAVTDHAGRSASRRTRLQRWRDAAAELLALQAEYEYADWLAALPDNLCARAKAVRFEL